MAASFIGLWASKSDAIVKIDLYGYLRRRISTLSFSATLSLMDLVNAQNLPSLSIQQLSYLLKTLQNL